MSGGTLDEANVLRAFLKNGFLVIFGDPYEIGVSKIRYIGCVARCCALYTRGRGASVDVSMCGS